LVAGLAWILFSRVAAAGVLPTDPAAIAGAKGSLTINGQDFAAKNSFKALVEYAVYDIGDFSNSAALGFPADPSGGTEYIYAYQIQNTGVDEALLLLSVGLFTGGVEDNASIVGFLASPNLNPNNSTFTPASVAPKTHARWSFTSGTFTVGLTSDVLYFASPNPPQWKTSSISGMNATAGSGKLPSPVPEPAAWVLAAFGAACLLAVKCLRRRAR
jgi:hypothetical protein